MLLSENKPARLIGEPPPPHAAGCPPPRPAQPGPRGSGRWRPTTRRPQALAPAPRFQAVFGWLVNVLRSLPFIILMIFVIPFTRALVGTSIG